MENPIFSASLGQKANRRTARGPPKKAMQESIGCDPRPFRPLRTKRRLGQRPVRTACVGGGPPKPFLPLFTPEPYGLKDWLRKHHEGEIKTVTVHGVLAFAMDAGTPRQQARNCGLEQRVSPDLEEQVSPDLEWRGSLHLKQQASTDLKQRVFPGLDQWISPCQSPPKIFPEFLPSADSRWILIPPRGMGCLPP